MKTKPIFTKAEAAEILKLIEQKLISDSSKQKGIRAKIRNLGFYASDFGLTKYDVADFKRFAKIDGGEMEKITINKTFLKNTEVKIKSEKIINKEIEFNIFEKNSIIELKKSGFKGFHSIKDIVENYNLLPKEKGVYILLNTEIKPEFLEEGTGGFFKGKNPNVAIEILKENWITDSQIIYIGKAGSETGSATLHSRLKQYFAFGQRKAIGHYGGRYIWQLKNSNNILVCWIETPKSDPRILEKKLITDFVDKFGKRPFANLVG